MSRSINGVTIFLILLFHIKYYIYTHDIYYLVTKDAQNATYMCHQIRYIFIRLRPLDVYVCHYVTYDMSLMRTHVIR